MFERKTQVLVAVVLMGLLVGAVGAFGAIIGPGPGPGLLGTTSLVLPDPYQFVGRVSGWLTSDGDFDIYEETLRGGQRYKITLSGPQSADFDILVFDENENLVTKSVGLTSDEVVYVTPRWTGPFFIVVMSYDGSGSYTMKLYRQA